jgi:RNA polymerase sigma-70 factor (ECF subfamily)
MTTKTPDELADVAVIIAAAQSGDGPSLRVLVKRYQSHLLRLARARLRSMPEGQRPSDLVQDTLERAVRCLHQFQGSTDLELRRWLAVILQNILIQQQRAAHRLRRAARLVELPESDQLIESDPAPGPSQSLRGREAWRALLRALYALPAGQREAVHRHLKGEAVSEIAQTLGKSPAAVSCLLQRGGKALQQTLGEHGKLGAWFSTMRQLLADAT